MRYHLDTIPVWDACKENSECLVCILEAKAERAYVESFLGGSVMEPATRIEVNDKGFCPHHNKMLFDAKNRLGLALMTHTHTVETIKKLKKLSGKAASDPSSKLLDRLVSRDRNSKKSARDLADWIRKHVTDCIICDRLANSMNRYIYTIIYLWEHEKEFRSALAASKGFCLPHLAMILESAADNLSTSRLDDFFSDIIPVELQNLERLEQELKWFTLKFDYRNQDKPWGNSRDAVQRVLQKLTGKYME
ncbi:MAG TPA: DUF6062 family protein [Candidatus Atribacteria bacterium]|nr:DUF6062 family protein [Candidatus Atribacteria bacterium]HPT77761.1 DUF6062 family protein [Candidatus Atribacteria bacterium]